MAVYERTWRRYAGPLTPLPWRFAVISRYALRDAFASRSFTIFYVLCSLPSVIALFLVYLSHNVGLVEQMGLTREFMGGLTLAFFQQLFGFQATPAFFVAVIVSPSLVAADLAHNGLPLYLCRPVNRFDYVVGKLAVLAVLLSPITWLASLLVFTLQASLEGGAWWLHNQRILWAHMVGHITWILVISLMTLAISAWVRHKWLARGGLFGIFFVLGGLSEMINLVTRTRYGDMLDMVEAIVSVVRHLFEPGIHTGLPLVMSWLTLIATCGISLLLLARKLRAHEEVR